jgi:hypothetical protein
MAKFLIPLTDDTRTVRTVFECASGKVTDVRESDVEQHHETERCRVYQVISKIRETQNITARSGAKASDRVMI